MTPAQELDDIERDTELQVQAAVTAAVAAGITGAALLAAAAAIAEAVHRGVQAAAAVGSRIATLGAPAARPRPADQLQIAPLPSLVDDDLTVLLVDAALALDTAIDRAAELARTRRRLRGLAIVKIHQATSAATFTWTSWLGVGLRWVARPDGCRVCRALHGRRVGPGERFTFPTGRGMPRRPWVGFRGLPPAHPGGCRCKALPDP